MGIEPLNGVDTRDLICVKKDGTIEEIDIEEECDHDEGEVFQKMRQRIYRKESGNALAYDFKSTFGDNNEYDMLSGWHPEHNLSHVNNVAHISLRKYDSQKGGSSGK